MKIYKVGGWCRDTLLKLTPNDTDFVVVGSTPEAMLSLGFKQVGAAFPVFLHPETKDEYALARKEVSTGIGYHDFKVDFSPDVSIEQDLMRRDFTMNAIAWDMEEERYIDPLGGMNDLSNHVLRATSDLTMVEDPLRALRAARFLSQYPFLKDDITFGNFRPDMKGLSAERVGAEMKKALMGLKPSRFFEFIRDHYLDAQAGWFHEVMELCDVPQTYKWHMEGCAFTHTMMVLDSVARAGLSYEHRFAALCHDLGKATTSPDILPSHHGHEDRGYYLVDDISDRLKIDNNTRRIAKLTAKYHTHVHNFDKLKAKTKVKIFNNIRGNITEVSDVIAKVSFHDNEGKLPYTGGYDNDKWFIATMDQIRLHGGLNVEPEELKKMSIDKIKNLKLANQISVVPAKTIIDVYNMPKP